MNPLRLLSALAFALLIAIGAYAAPVLINYQGILEDPLLPPIANVDIEFRLWANAAPTEAEPLLWGQRYRVRVAEGRFHVILGSEGRPGGVVELPDHAVSDPERFAGLLDADVGVIVGDALRPHGFEEGRPRGASVRRGAQARR